MVTIRTVSVGRPCLNESIALIRVSEPPYMFSAVTDTRPSAAKISTIAPKPLKTLSPAALIAAMPCRTDRRPAHAGRATAPRHISQTPPSAEPQ